MKSEIIFPVLSSEILGLKAFRGSGKLSDISRISKADVFDEVKNRRGTQRNLKIRHAKSAYEYVKNLSFGFWPEVVLCCRMPEVIRFDIVEKDLKAGLLHVDVDKIQRINKGKGIAISRIDGNHRLYYADGSEEGFEPIDKNASFCLLTDLSIEQEIQLFRDINNNLERMPTSHLDYITVRLTPEETLKSSDPNLYIANRLNEDSGSPFFKRVSKTGKRTEERDIPLRSLKTGIQYLKTNTKQLQIMSASDADIEYLLIKNYFLALRKWQPEAWITPDDYLLLRGSGFWGACFLGGLVIDRCLNNGSVEVDDMYNLLKSGKDWDWSNRGEFKGLGGRNGAKKISDMINTYLPTKTGVSIIAMREKLSSKLKKS